MSSLDFFIQPRMFVLYFIILSAIYIHFRGKVRFKFIRQLTDHSTLMAPINVFLYIFSKLPQRPYLDLKFMPALAPIQENWEIIRDEALKLKQSEMIKRSDGYNDIGFNSFFKKGWKRFYLKWYNDFHPSSVEHCPKTIEIMKEIPSVKAAMFVVLPGGSELPKHRDPYAGSMRYHLGLVTPNDPKCFIDVDGEQYYWKDGEAVLFDETYLHYAKNETDKDRLIFFCDIERPVYTWPVRLWNKFFSWFIMSSSASPNMEKDKTGNLNKAFHYLYQVRLVAKKLKEKNRFIYYLLKYVITFGVVYLIFFL